MKSQHLIENAIFDTTYVETAMAENHRRQVDDFVKNNLLPVIEETFDQVDRQLSVSGTILRTEILEIDLGEIALSQYRQQMPEKLRKELLQALNNFRPAHSKSMAAANFPEIGTTAQSPLFYYLSNGYLPWYAKSDAADNPATLDTMLLESIEQSPKSLLEFMLSNVERDALLQRLVNQFSSQSLQQMMSLLSATPGSLAQYFRMQLETRLRVNDSVELPTAETLLPAAAQQNVRIDGAGQGEWDEPIGSLHQQLVTALLAQQTVQFESIWSGLLADHSRLLEQTVRYYGQQLRVRRQIVAGFTTTMRIELLRLLEPDNQGWLQLLVENVDLFLQQDGNLEHRRQHRQSEIWEFLLGFLLVERDHRFDEKVCLQSLLRQLAVSSDVSEALILTRFKRNLDVLSGARVNAQWPVRLARLVETIDSFELSQEFASVNDPDHVDTADHSVTTRSNDRVEIVEGTVQVGATEGVDPVGSDEATDSVETLTVPKLAESSQSGGSGEPIGATGRPQPEQSIGQSASSGAPRELANGQVIDSRQAQSYRQYERVKSALTIPGRLHRVIESNLMDDIKNLQHETPWMLQRLYRELQTGNYDWLQVSASWPSDLLAELCHALLSLNSQANNERPYGLATELVMAIQRKATQSSDRQLLYADVFGRLIKGEIIDLDAMPAQPEIENLLAEQSEGVEATIDQPALAGKTSINNLRDLGNLSHRARAQMLRSAELLTTAVYLVESGLVPERLDAMKWQFIRSYLAATGNLFNDHFFVRGYVDHLIQQLQVSDAEGFRNSLVQGLLQDSLPATQESTQRLIEVLSKDTDDIPRFIEPEVAETTEIGDELLPLEDLYLSNAGMVLLAPYLPRLFDQLGFTNGGKFKTRDAAERAVHCLQFLVNSSSSSPEYQLVLNKLLCGVEPGLPICRGIELSVDEREQLESLLMAVTQHWKALANTSIDGLRESFLQRNGRLLRKDDSWQLNVETRTFDMLLDQIPWSFNTIKFAWMDRIIYVEWQ